MTTQTVIPELFELLPSKPILIYKEEVHVDSETITAAELKLELEKWKVSNKVKRQNACNLIVSAIEREYVNTKSGIQADENFDITAINEQDFRDCDIFQYKIKVVKKKTIRYVWLRMLHNKVYI